jgi:hypothetical protein
VFSKLKDWKLGAPTFYECVFSNNVYHDENGHIQEHVPGDPQYREDLQTGRPGYGQDEPAARRTSRRELHQRSKDGKVFGRGSEQ